MFFQHCYLVGTKQQLYNPIFMSISPRNHVRKLPAPAPPPPEHRIRTHQLSTHVVVDIAPLFSALTEPRHLPSTVRNDRYQHKATAPAPPLSPLTPPYPTKALVCATIYGSSLPLPHPLHPTQPHLTLTPASLGPRNHLRKLTAPAPHTHPTLKAREGIQCPRMRLSTLPVVWE